jgi:hypothetical protein
MEHPIGQLLNLGHIPPSLSPCASPTFVIPNKDDSEWHLVTHYHALNKANVKTRYLLPWIEELLDHLQGDYSFTQMDLTVGYHQVHMNATSHLGKCMIIYLDDILVFSNSWAEHLQHICNILELLRAHTLQVKKSYVGHTSVPHLGLILDTTGGRSDPSRVQVLAQWPTHSNSHDLKIFLQKVGHHFAQLPPTLYSAQVLHFPDRNQPFEIKKDAFQFTSGAVLKQGGHSMEFHSETLAPSGSTHHQQEHQSAQHFIHMLTQRYTQEATSLRATQDHVKQRHDKKHTPLFFQLGDHVWLLLDKYQFKHQHHLQCNFPHLMAEAGMLPDLNREELGHQEVCPTSLATQDEGALLN